MIRATALTILLIAGPAHAQWRVEHRVALSPSGEPIDLASLAGSQEQTVRIAVSGSFHLLYDGSEIDAFGVDHADRRDESLGMLVLPAGARIVESDAALHRYVIEVPRAPTMPVALNLMPLAMRHLITPSEVRAQLQGAIVLEHLVQPAPVPAMALVAGEAESVPMSIWLGGALGLGLLGGLGLFSARRRRDRVRALLRHAHRAQRVIERECAALGPAFDPVVASSKRLLEAAERSQAHRRAVERALVRTAWTSAAHAERARLHEQAEAAVARLTMLVARLEQTATELAARNATRASAERVEELLTDLKDDLDTAASVEDELLQMTS